MSLSATCIHAQSGEAEFGPRSPSNVAGTVAARIMIMRALPRYSLCCMLSQTYVSGEWGSGDDRRLLRGLAKSGATQEFQVDWGNLVTSRTAQQTRRRWRLMLKCVKDATNREFHENLDTLLQTFTPDLLPTADGQQLNDHETVEELT